MKLLTLSNYYPEHPGGVEFVALNLVSHWRTHHQVRWMACDVQKYPHSCEPDDIPLPASNFAEERLGFPYPIPVGRSFRQIFEQVRWCDVVHVHDSLYLANIVALLASRWYQKPLLVTQHVALVPYSQAYKNLLQKLAYRTLGKLVLENAEKVVFISQRVQNWFEAQMRFHRETALIPNGVNREMFYPPTIKEREIYRTQLGFSPDEIVCLFVGRFTQKKGLHLIREIAQARPYVRWLLVGRDELDPRAWRLDNIRVISPLPQAALRRYYTAADLFVLPSVGEGFPLAVQEALSCGLPAAVSEEIADHVPDAPLIKLDPAALPALLRTLDDAFKVDGQLRGLRSEAAQYAKRWDWVNAAREYEDLFAELTLFH